MRKVALAFLALLMVAGPALAGGRDNPGPDRQGGKENGRRDHGGQHGHP